MVDGFVHQIFSRIFHSREREKDDVKMSQNIEENEEEWWTAEDQKELERVDKERISGASRRTYKGYERKIEAWIVRRLKFVCEDGTGDWKRFIQDIIHFKRFIHKQRDSKHPDLRCSYETACQFRSALKDGCKKRGIVKYDDIYEECMSDFYSCLAREQTEQKS